MMLDFASDADFLAAVLAGGVGALAVLAISLARARGGRMPPLAGVAVAVAAAVVVAERLALPTGVVTGLVALVAAGALVDAIGAPVTFAAVFAVPGAALVAYDGDVVPVGWIRAVVVVTIVVGGAGMASTDRRWGRLGLTPPCFALAAAGAYFTVPDPYQAVVVFGASAPSAVLVLRPSAARFGSTGAFPAVALFAWAVAMGGYGRQSSIVGGLACLGVLVLEPLVWHLHRRAWSPWDALPRGMAGVVVALGVQIALVAVASRVAGLQSPAEYVPGRPLWRGSVAPAVGILAVEAVVAVVAARFVRRRTVHA